MSNYPDLYQAKIYAPSLQLRAKALLELRRREQARQQTVIQPRTIDESLNWIKSEFYIPERNGPIELYPYQEAVLREAYRRDESGNFVYSVVVWSDIKKSAKSSIAAAVALERMSYAHYGSVKIIGNDIKQADSRTAEYARRAVALNPRLAQQVKVIRYKMEFENHSVIEAIPIDPSGEAGGNDDLIIYTEAWGLKDKKDLQMWEEQRISPNKFGQGQIWVESYAGFEGESPVLWDLYEKGKLNGERLDLGIDGLEVYRNGTQLTLWNDTPRLPWQTPEYYTSEAGSMTDSAFNRVHRNQWASSMSAFIPREWWTACKTQLPPLRNNEPCVAIIDAAVSNDCFGLVVISRDGDKILVRYSRKWKPAKGKKLEYVNLDNPDDVDYPEGELRRLNRELNIICVVYDPYQMADMSNRIMRVIGINTYAFNQGQDRAFADKMLFDLIRDRRIMHEGDEDLTEHISNANQKAEGDNKLRLVKRADDKKIDLAVCLSMGSYYAIKVVNL